MFDFKFSCADTIRFQLVIFSICIVFISNKSVHVPPHGGQFHDILTWRRSLERSSSGDPTTTATHKPRLFSRLHFIQM